MSSGRSGSPLFNATGMARQLRASPLFAFGPAQPGPAIRRGFLVAMPVGIALTVELGFDSPTKGAIATGALLAGFPGLDAPARPRAGWQAASAPAIGFAAALGVLSGQTIPTAVLAMGLLGAAAGYCFSVSLRLAIAGLAVALAMMIAQGLFLPVHETLSALLYATIGGVVQALWSLLVWILADRMTEQPERAWSTRRALADLRADLDLDSPNARHAIRFGTALAVGVLVYRVLDLHEHGFWVPLTILFVMRPQREETYHRLILRAIGTAIGLVLATAIAEAFGAEYLIVGIVLTIAAAFSYGMLTVQYALFTAAITVYVVVLTVTLGEPAIDAAGQRALGTALGIAISALAFVLWPDPGEGKRRAGGPTSAPEPAAR